MGNIKGLILHNSSKVKGYDDFINEGLFKRVFGGKKKEQEKTEEKPKPFVVNPESDYTYLLSILDKAKSDPSIINLTYQEIDFSEWKEDETRDINFRVKFRIKVNKLKRFKSSLKEDISVLLNFSFNKELNITRVTIYESYDLIGKEWAPASKDTSYGYGGGDYSLYKKSDGNFSFEVIYVYSKSRFTGELDIFGKKDIKEGLDSMFDYIRDKEPSSSYDYHIDDVLKRSNERYQRDVLVDDVNSNINKIKECFYDLMDISENNSVNIEHKREGGSDFFKVIFTVKGLKVPNTSHITGTNQRYNVDWARFELNDTLIKVISSLSDIKPMLMDIISDDIEVDVVLKNDTVIVSIKI